MSLIGKLEKRHVLPKMTFDLPRPFRMVGVQREDDTPLHKAVREAFINSIIHADMIMESGVLRIEKHDDMLVFRNPGLLRLPVEQIYEGGISFARNPKIQNMLRMIGYGENLGSGFPMILDAWRQSGWGEPDLKNKIEMDEVELVLPLYKIENHTENHTENYTGLSRIQREILIKLKENPSYSRRELASVIENASLGGVIYALSALQKSGFIRRVGPDKGGHWEVIGE